MSAGATPSGAAPGPQGPSAPGAYRGGGFKQVAEAAGLRWCLSAHGASLTPPRRGREVAAYLWPTPARDLPRCRRRVTFDRAGQPLRCGGGATASREGRLRRLELCAGKLARTVVRPGKADVSSRSQSCRGKNRKPRSSEGRAGGKPTVLKPLDNLTWRVSASCWAVTIVNARWPRK
jgi:hypothetical protein